MLVENTSGIAGLAFEQLHRDGQTMAVTVARGKWRLFSDGTLQAVESKILLADMFAGDPHRNDLLIAGDLIPYKPTADVTLIGEARASEPQKSITAGIQIGSHSASLRATGPRQWVYGKSGWTMTEAPEISQTTLSYRAASGGRIIGHPDGDVDPRNPIGSGLIDPEFTPTQRTYAAPNIDAEHAPISLDPRQPAAPQGFGPIPPWWQARSQYAGTYDGDWTENRSPRLPADFDYRFYQTAHPGLIQRSYLHPSQSVRTIGLATSGQGLDFTLPDLVPWARFSFSDGREVDVRLNLDGMHLDIRGDEWWLDLTWRGWMEICPAFYRVDLHSDDSASAHARDLVWAGLHSLSTEAP
ncbi:DUF2169 domain-containing protein [Paracoccus sp. 11-3]|uniref:DUF2169 domain-containing protein n=1 Tax=Paracoccus amoyensis TaxID=2760093 RepID=A0A926J7I1_9RHOB|nr:DUF2169 domain-containing protein [Paracoccus amoyensis]MBC9248362.1 DUF2169 domain-containing protein [Paracoccus amoyensis]